MDETKIRHSTYRHRADQGRAIDRSLKRERNRGLQTVYGRPELDLLEQKCSTMILDCIDWQQLATELDVDSALYEDDFDLGKSLEKNLT
jgi:hypothetical protein